MSEPTTEPGLEPATTRADRAETEVGSVFVSNYPAYSFWGEADLPKAHTALATPPHPDTRLGLYLHIPFCRKRCKFCYFRVYTDKNADQIQTYLDALAHEVEHYAQRPGVSGRPLHFVYFGGGTPSLLSDRGISRLMRGFKGVLPWDFVREVTFECAPKSVTTAKLEVLHEVGVTRISLGLQQLDDRVLQGNGRVHLTHDAERAYAAIRRIG